MDKNTKRPVTAYTTNSNTAESDRQPKVMHTVVFSDMSKMQIYATDPIDALRMAEFLCEK